MTGDAAWDKYIVVFIVDPAAIGCEVVIEGAYGNGDVGCCLCRRIRGDI
jgi:hypothetical protein